MRELLAHAMKLGVNVHVAHLPRPYLGYYDSDAKIVVYDFNLAPAMRLYVLAHELGHAFYDHDCQGNAKFEEAADLYAARLLIHPEDYAAAAAADPDPESIAFDLGLPVKVVCIYRDRLLTRVGETVYARSKMGKGQYAWSSARNLA